MVTSYTNKKDTKMNLDNSTNEIVVIPSTWYVYLLVNEKGRTYIGSTTNVNRRLRQHNREIVGGARSTRNHGPWRIYCYLSGFPNRSSACRWEKLLKMRARGLNQRRMAFIHVSQGECPVTLNGRGMQYSVPAGLVLETIYTYIGE